MPATTRSNRRRDWKQLMLLRTPRFAINSAQENTYRAELEILNSLPTMETKNIGKNPSTRKAKTLNDELLDTSSFPPTETPQGFALELLQHQKRGLSWMLSVEDANRPIIGKNEKNENVRIYGGIVADKPGTGKSVLMIALMKMNPCKSFFQDNQNRIRSKATLLLCPRNIVVQWANEFQRCDRTMKVVQITTAKALTDISCLEVALADVIIMPYYLLAEPFYMGNANHLESIDAPRLTSYEDLAIYRGVLSRFHFHRIVYDEVHEIYDQTRNHNSPFVPFMENFHSNWRWGLTGTPPKDVKLFYDVMNCISRANLDLTKVDEIRQLRNQIVRSNNPDLGVPVQRQEIKWIDLSAQELAVYNLFRNRSIDAQLMACSHFNVNDFPMGNIMLNAEMTIDEVTEKLQKGYEKNINDMKEALPKARDMIPKIRAKLSNLQQQRARLPKEDTQKRVENEKKLTKQLKKLRDNERIISKCTTDIPKLEREMKYFSNILKALETKSDEQETCSICWEEFEEFATVALTACGHVFCIDCITRVGSPCPNCRSPIMPNSIMKVSLNRSGADNVAESQAFGSKIKELVIYIGAQISIDPSFKFIIFVQYSKLARIAVNALKQAGIDSVNLSGTVNSRSTALKKFEHSNNPVLVMSAEQSVSGVNIIAASHVIIFHPFNLGSDAQSIAAEEQGIARARRLGQTKSVQVVRFVTRGTIEERITLERISNQQITE